MKAKDIMNPKVISVSPDAKIKEIMDKMVNNEISSIIVLDQKKRLLGIVTKKDLVSRGEGFDIPTYVNLFETFAKYDDQQNELDYLLERLKDIRAKDLMSQKLYFVHANASVREVIDKLTENVTHLPVIGTGMKPVGIISRTDLMRFINKLISKGSAIKSSNKK